MKRDKTWKINARRIRRVLLALAVILLAGAGISLWRSKYALEVTRASFPWPGTEPVRIVQLTDLHNSVFGKDNEKLVQTVAGEDPDLIFITGDLVDQNSASSEIAVLLVRKLAAIAPVYISYGNHEAGFDRRYGADLAAEYEAAGAEVLDFAWQEITVRGEKIRLGGIFGYCLPEKYLRTNEADERECAFLKEFQDTIWCSPDMCTAGRSGCLSSEVFMLRIRAGSPARRPASTGRTTGSGRCSSPGDWAAPRRSPAFGTCRRSSH